MVLIAAMLLVNLQFTEMKGKFSFVNGVKCIEQGLFFSVI